VQVAHQFEVHAARDRAFAFLQDVSLLAPCLPGCRDLKELEPNRYAAVIEIQVAFLKLKFDVQVQIVEAQAPERLLAKIVGKPAALAGQLTMTADMVLTEVDGTNTHLAYEIDLGLTGKLGSVGQSAFRAKAEEMGRRFAENVKAALEGQAAGVTA
jgi:uncharacterized protein